MTTKPSGCANPSDVSEEDYAKFYSALAKVGLLIYVFRLIDMQNKKGHYLM